MDGMNRVALMAQKMFLPQVVKGSRDETSRSPSGPILEATRRSRWEKGKILMAL